MTEASHQMTSQTYTSSVSSPESVGIPHGCQVAVFEVDKDEKIGNGNGEICVRGNNVFHGYLRNPEANKRAFTKCGYFRYIHHS